jgi:hypothetical protein
VPAALGATAQPVLDRSRADPRLGSLGRAAVDRLPGGWSVWRAPHNPSTWALVALDCAVDTSTPSGEVMANMLVTFARFERSAAGWGLVPEQLIQVIVACV